MSKRFGRNQKRRMREEIALQSMLRRQAQAALESESAGRLEEKRKRLRLEAEMSDWARRIVELLGPESAFARDLHEELVGASLFDSVTAGGRPYRVEPREPTPWLSPSAGTMALNDARTIIDLFATYARPDRDGIAYRWRFAIRSRTGDRAIMMDERTLCVLTQRGDRDLVEFLITQLIEPWAKGKHA